jgi:hydroxymethylpyrimidine/phosphomethylpyrimidine kinase
MTEEKKVILERLSFAISTLTRSLHPDFIPEKGADIAFAKSGARDIGDIASVRGGITVSEGRVTASEAVFGAGGLPAKVLLTAMKFDPVIRSVGIIRCTPFVVRMLDEMFFETCTFDPLAGPEGISTMDWGVAGCCRNGVPDAIYSSGTRGREPLVRFFGEEPGEVANNIIMVSARIIDAHTEE